MVAKESRKQERVIRMGVRKQEMRQPVDKCENGTERGDAILKRMLQMKPKPHKEMVKERKTKRARKKGAK